MNSEMDKGVPVVAIFKVGSTYNGRFLFDKQCLE
jgi:hypothetical protein